jgi:hypothetical protein
MKIFFFKKEKDALNWTANNFLFVILTDDRKKKDETITRSPFFIQKSMLGFHSLVNDEQRKN